MKSVMLSIKPRFCELIESGKQTIEIRKTIPKIPAPFKCYIYCCKQSGSSLFSGKVIGEFICAEITEYPYISCDLCEWRWIPYQLRVESSLSNEEIEEYGGKKTLYGWHISDLVIYDEPKELSEFRKPCVRSNEWEHIKCDGCEELIYSFGCGRTLLRPPQSWCYVEESEEK